MRAYFFKNPWWLSLFYAKATFSYAESDGIYLTFDDGPDPEVTPWVLEILNKYGAKATFFLVGNRVERYPELVRDIIEAGHMIGNHTHDHASGWQSENDRYLQQVAQCQQAVDHYSPTKIFRPPYGRIRLTQLTSLVDLGYEVVMWSHLSGDFDLDLNIQKSLAALRTAEPGSILSFHDSQKAFENLKQLLPEVLDHFSTLHFSFKAIK